MPANLETATTVTSLGAGRVGGDGGHVLEAADLEARAGEGADSSLSAGAGGLGAGATSSAELDVDSGDAAGLDLLSDVLGSEHGRIRGGLIAVSLDLHAASGLANGLTAGEIGDMDVGVVERGKDVGNAEHLLARLDLGSLRLDA